MNSRGTQREEGPCRHGRQRPGTGAGSAVAVSLLLLALTAGSHAGEDGVPRGNPFRGREVFGEQGCGRCHSVWGHGGELAPDITVAVMGKTWYELVGAFWNHTPGMIDEVTERGYSWPILDADEMADTLSFLHYLRLFDEPGDAVRGADTYARLQCANCHTLGENGGAGGGPLDRFSIYPAPAPLAQAMWNAGPRMQEEQLRRGNPIPQFVGHEMADLQAYIRSEALREGREIELQALPDPIRGAEVYRAKRCGVCHDGARGRAPDISRSVLSRTASEITGMLWNHSYAMGTEMAARGVRFPRFRDTELSDLIAHLYFLGYAGEEGDPGRGALVFAEKGCTGCHEGDGGAAPDLAESLDGSDRAGLAAAMWNHAPQMYRLMAEESPFWPKFEPGEMRDLVAFLRDPARSSGAGQP